MRKIVSATAPRVAVVGGGVSGLSCAHFLLKRLPKASVTVFDKSHRLGGLVQSSRIGLRLVPSPTASESFNPTTTSVQFEEGPNSIRGATASPQSALVYALIRDLEFQLGTALIHDCDETKAGRRFLISDSGALNELRPADILREMILPALRNFSRPNPGANCDETLASFLGRHFGFDATQKYLSAFVSGVFGGGMTHLSAQSISPFDQLKAVEMSRGSVLYHLLLQYAAHRSKNDAIKQQIEAFVDSHLNDAKLDESSNVKSTPNAPFTTKGGLNSVITSLKTVLQQSDVEFKLGTAVQRIMPLTAARNGHNGVRLEISSDKDAKGDSMQSASNSNTHSLDFDHVFVATAPRFIGEALDSGVPRDSIVSNASSSLLTVSLAWINPPQFAIENELLDAFGALKSRSFALESRMKSGIKMSLDDSLLGVIYQSSVFGQLESDSSQLRMVFMFGGSGFEPEAFSNEDAIKAVVRTLKRSHKLDVCAAFKEDGNHSTVSFPFVDVSPSVDLGAASGQQLEVECASPRRVPLLFNVKRLRDCIEHYSVGHCDKLTQMKADIADAYGHNCVSLVGAGFDGVGITHNVFSALKHSTRFCDVISETTP